MTLKLTPQKQRCKHDPENGIHGDCYRTAVAVALGLPAEVVPHVYAGEGQEGGGGLDAMRAWLAARGLGLFEAHLNPAETLESVLALSARAPGVPTIISGFSPRGFNHSIVALDGAVACDPFDGSDNPEALVGPAKGDAGDAFWWIEVLVVTPALRVNALSAVDDNSSRPARDRRPRNCRFRLQEQGRPYPRSSCGVCGKSIATGLGKECTAVPRSES